MLIKPIIMIQRIINHNCISLCKRIIKIPQRHAATYEGEGKTHVSILNKENGAGIMIDAVNPIGFKLNNGVTVIGPCVLFPKTVLSWNIASIEDIHERSLELLTLLCPKIDIIVFGYGDRQNKTKDFESKILKFSRQNKISFELLPTEEACTTFNFLNSEHRYVAAALVPATQLKIYDDNEILTNLMKNKANLTDIQTPFYS